MWQIWKGFITLRDMVFHFIGPIRVSIWISRCFVAFGAGALFVSPFGVLWRWRWRGLAGSAGSAWLRFPAVFLLLLTACTRRCCVALRLDPVGFFSMCRHVVKFLVRGTRTIDVGGEKLEAIGGCVAQHTFVRWHPVVWGMRVGVVCYGQRWGRRSGSKFITALRSWHPARGTPNEAGASNEQSEEDDEQCPAYRPRGTLLPVIRLSTSTVKITNVQGQDLR